VAADVTEGRSEPVAVDVAAGIACMPTLFISGGGSGDNGVARGVKVISETIRLLNVTQLCMFCFLDGDGQSLYMYMLT